MNTALRYPAREEREPYDPAREIAETWVAYEQLNRAANHYLRRLTRLEDRLVQLLDGRDQLHQQLDRAMTAQIEALKLIAQIKDRR